MSDDFKGFLESYTADGQLPSEELLPLVYDELRNLAAARMRGEAEGQTLQATALVHEAWIRVSGKGGRTWNDRAHFFRVAALEMRRILVESARRKSSLKRGSEFERVEMSEVELADTQPSDRILLVEDALKRLEVEDPDLARLVILKFFGGLTNQEVAAMEGAGERTIERQWATARVCLFEMMRDRTDESDGPDE